MYGSFPYLILYMVECMLLLCGVKCLSRTHESWQHMSKMHCERSFAEYLFKTESSILISRNSTEGDLKQKIIVPGHLL